MPTYEYRCLTCDLQFEVQASMKEAQPQRGPTCTAGDCMIQKCLSKVHGHIAGASQAPREPTSPTVKAPSTNSHVCSKYCDFHK